MVKTCKCLSRRDRIALECLNWILACTRDFEWAETTAWRVEKAFIYADEFMRQSKTDFSCYT